MNSGRRVGLLAGTCKPLNQLTWFAPHLQLQDVAPILGQASLFRHWGVSPSPQLDARKSLETVNRSIATQQPIGRFSFMNTMKSELYQRGKLIVVAGPVNTGKTTAMKWLKKSHPESTVLLELSSHNGDIGAALLAQMTTPSSGQVISSVLETIGALLKSFKLTIPIPTAPLSVSTNELANKVRSDTMTTVSIATRELVKRYSKAQQPLTIIIDDADLAITGELDNKAARQVLDLLVNITKKDSAGNVVLVTNRLNFLADILHQLQFNTAYFSPDIFIGELEPREAWHVLVDQWQLAPSTAELLISTYGGDIGTIVHALQHLASDGEQFNPRSVWSHGLEDDIIACVEDTCITSSTDKSHGKADRLHMLLVMKQLFQLGFTPIRRLSDPVVQCLTHRGLAVVVKATTRNVQGVDAAQWAEYGDCHYALVSSRQWIRLAIGHVLKKQLHIEKLM